MLPLLLLLTVIEDMGVNKIVFCGLACQHWVGERLGTKTRLYSQVKQEVFILLKLLLMVLIDGFYTKLVSNSTCSPTDQSDSNTRVKFQANVWFCHSSGFFP